MKSFRTSLLLTILGALILTGCGTGFASETAPMFETFPGQFLFGDVYILRKHQKIDGDIAGIGTTLIIEEGALVMGDISLIGSNLEIAGNVAGDLNVIAGTSIIRNSAILTGNINQISTAVVIEENALVNGSINSFVFPTAGGQPSGEGFAKLLEWLQPERILLIKFAQVLAMTLATSIIIYLFTEPTYRVTQAIRGNLPASWGAGLLTYLAVPVISIVLVITICLSPVGLVILIAFLLSLLWGWAALAAIIGDQLVTWLRLDWKTQPSAILGAIVFGLATAFISFIPCLGFFINLIISSFGLGGVLISRFGTFSEQAK